MVYEALIVYDHKYESDVSPRWKTLGGVKFFVQRGLLYWVNDGATLA